MEARKGGIGRDVAAWRERYAYERENMDGKSVDKVVLSSEWIRLTKLYFAKARRAEKAKL